MALRKNCGGPRKAKIKLTGSSCLKRCCSQASLDAQNETKLNASLAQRQRADLLWANISANKLSLSQGQSYTDQNFVDPRTLSFKSVDHFGTSEHY